MVGLSARAGCSIALLKQRPRPRLSLVVLVSKCMLATAVDGRRTVVLTGEDVPDVAQGVHVGKGVRHGSGDRSHGQQAGEQLRGPHCGAGMPNATNSVGSMARETGEGCGAEVCCGAGSATGACWRVNKRRDGWTDQTGAGERLPFSSTKKTSDW